MATRLSLLSIIAGAIFLVGCGGSGSGGSSAATTSQSAVRFSVEWPASSRAVGTAEAKSVTVTVRVNGAVEGTATLERPEGGSGSLSSQATIGGLSAGDAVTTATALDASGKVVAQGETTAKIGKGETLVQSTAVSETEVLDVKIVGTQSGTGGLAIGIH